MKHFAGKARWLSSAALVLALVFTLGLTLSGCSNDDDAPAEVSYATLVVKHTLAYERSLGNEVQHLVISGYDEAGELTFEPTEFARTNFYSMKAPLATKSVRLVYLDTADNAMGLYAQPVTLQSGSEYVISDPAWQDLDSQNFLTQITISPEEPIVETGSYFQLEAMGTFTSGGSSFVQTLTDDADWYEAEDNSLLSSKGKGSYEALKFGDTEAVAFYGGVSASVPVAVLGCSFDVLDGLSSLENILPEEYKQFSYIIPMCMDDAAHVQPKYASKYAFAPAVYRLPASADADNLTVAFSDESVMEAEVVKAPEPGIKKWVAFHPKKIGRTTVKISYTKGEGETASEKVLAYLSLETADATLKALWNRPMAKQELLLPEEMNIVYGDSVTVIIMGVFKDAAGRMIYTDASGICGHTFNYVAGKEVEFSLEGDSYVSGSDAVIIHTVYQHEYDKLQEGETSLYTHTLTAPSGVEIYVDLDDLPIGSSWNTQIGISQQLP